MADSETILKAFAEGARKISDGNYQDGAYNRSMSTGNPVQTIGQYDPTTSAYLTNSFSSLNVDRSGMRPGQRLGHHGTTIYNPLRSAKEVEEILGEKKYNPKIEEKSPEQMLVRQAELENQVQTLQKQMSVLIAALQTQAQTAVDEGNVVPLPVLPVEKTYEERTVSDLRNEAKEKSLPYVGKNKKQLIEILKENVPAGA